MSAGEHPYPEAVGRTDVKGEGPESAKYEQAAVTSTPPTDPARPAAEAALALPASGSLYEERLREIWAATHGGFGPLATDAGWDLVRAAVTGVDNLALIGAAVASLRRERIAGMAENVGLAGDYRTVMLLISTALEQLESEHYPAFMAGTVVSTLARLEREGFSREQIVDIVVRALAPVRGTAVAGRLVPWLHGYLSGDQRPPTMGVYLTVAQLAQLTVGLEDRGSNIVRSFLYHRALAGAWHLLQDQDAAFTTQAREVISGSAGNAGVNIWHLMPQSGADAPGADVVREMRSIQVFAVRELSVPESQAAAILDALGLAHAEARAALTVLDGMGALGGSWTRDPVAMARLESGAALSTAAAAANLSQVAVRLYNAAVSLIEAPEPAALHARLMLNLLGLRWSLLLGDDLLDALDRLEGLDCAAAFLRVVWQYLDEGYDHPQAWSAVSEFAALLNELAGRLPRNRPNLVAGVARFAEAAGQLRLRIPVIHRDSGRDIDIVELGDATVRTIDALRPSGTSPHAAVMEDNLLDSATLLRGIFADLLGQPRWGLLDTLNELVSRRDQAREEFLARYERFTGPGAAPAVVAGAVTPDEWRAADATFLRDPGSIVPVIANEFPSA